MSEKNLKSKKIERVELLPDSIVHLETWLKQIAESCPEVTISKKDLVNWALLEHKEILTDSDLRKIRECFFDPVQYLRRCLKKAEAAKLQGKSPEIPELLLGTPKSRKQKTSTAAIPKSETLEINDEKKGQDPQS